VDYSFEIVENRNRNKRDIRPILNQRIPTMVKSEVMYTSNYHVDLYYIVPASSA